MLNFLGVNDQSIKKTKSKGENKLNELFRRLEDDDHGFIPNKEEHTLSFIRVDFSTPEARLTSYKKEIDRSRKQRPDGS